MQNLNCNQVLALLTFFIENRLTPTLMQSVEYHLNICPNCRGKYFNLRKVLNNYQDIKSKITEEDENSATYREKQYKIFKNNLSAYIDNELNDEENLRIRKIAIANSTARQDLEDVLEFRGLIQESIKKTKNELKSDLSEEIINKIYKGSTPDKKYGLIAALLPKLLFIVMIVLFILLFRF